MDNMNDEEIGEELLNVMDLVASTIDDAYPANEETVDHRKIVVGALAALMQGAVEDLGYSFPDYCRQLAKETEDRQADDTLKWLNSRRK